MIGRGFSSAMRLITVSSNASCMKVRQASISELGYTPTYLDGGETQQGSGFHVVDNIDELLDRWTSVVLAREV